MKKRLEKTGISLIAAAVSLIVPTHVSAHIFDERPGLGTGITIILSVIWIAVVTGIVFLVRRLMRPQRGAAGDRIGEGYDGSKKNGPRELD